MKEKINIINILIPIVAVLLAFLVGAILILCVGKNPILSYSFLLKGAFGNSAAVGETLVKATPLAFTGLCTVFAYRCGMINLGGEGQFIIGSVGTAWFALTMTSLPPLIVIIGSLIFGTLTGALWGAIPGFLKAYKGTNEMIVSILLNYVATLFMSFLYCGPMKEAEIPQTAAVSDAVKLPKIQAGSRVHVGIFIVILASLLIYYFLYKTHKGYELRAVGFNPTASLVNGFPVKRLMAMSLVVSGAIAGLGGGTELLGHAYRLQAGYASGFGFDGVAIALIAQLDPVATVVVAYLFAVLRCGSNTMQVMSGIPTAIVDIIKGTIILFAVSGAAIVQMPELAQLLHKKKNSRQSKGGVRA